MQLNVFIITELMSTSCLFYFSYLNIYLHLESVNYIIAPGVILCNILYVTKGFFLLVQGQVA